MESVRIGGTVKPTKNDLATRADIEDKSISVSVNMGAKGKEGM